MKTINQILQVKNLKKQYSIGGSIPATILKGISFSASLGETIIIMGPSGAGKSTILNLLAGLEEPTEGNVKINNQNIFRMTEEERTEFRRDNLGIIFQFFELHLGLTCRETLELKFMINKVSRNSNTNQIASLLKEVGLGEKIDMYTDELSRGEKQRVAIARALITSPLIILADEPTGALDIETGCELMRLLRQKAKEINGLLIISTHDYNIPQDGDRVLLLEDGIATKDIPQISRAQFLYERGIQDVMLETI
ncbi:MAG: ABC transporter ATP-binding protein [Promethearchaeota archaeon]